VNDRQQALAHAYQALREELATILYEEDPGTMGSHVGAPPDEYAEEAGRLSTMLKGSTSEGETGRVLRGMFTSPSPRLVSRVHEAWGHFLARVREPT
jgi:hypothetical protein